MILLRLRLFRCTKYNCIQLTAYPSVFLHGTKIDFFLQKCQNHYLSLPR
eukprot:12128.XXX_338755_338901_1 [CDS] Oithona nana genome sequencing.